MRVIMPMLAGAIVVSRHGCSPAHGRVVEELDYYLISPVMTSHRRILIQYLTIYCVDKTPNALCVIEQGKGMRKHVLLLAF